MSYYSDFINGIKIIKGMVLMGLFLCLLPSCGTIMLPPLEVVSCSVENNTVFIEFSLPPDFSSLKNGLSVTEDGKSWRETSLFWETRLNLCLLTEYRKIVNT